MAAKQRDIEITHDYIEWMLKRQEENKARIELLEKVLCRRSDNYVDDVKNYKISLILVTFLKSEIAAIENNSLSLLQKRQWARKMKKFMKVYESGRFFAMIQQDENGVIVIPEQILDGNEEDEEETLLILEDPSVIVIEDDEDDDVDAGVIVPEEPDQEVVETKSVRLIHTIS